MNVTLSHTLMIPNGEVYKIMDSQGLVLWKKERKYTISFNANGGTGTMADQEFTFGELKALPTRGAKLDIDNLHIEVIKMKGKRIDSIKVTVLPKEEIDE